MKINKIEKIKSIKGEVNGFHPILKVLFQNLPNITNVEYTHGQNEMGADFILTKFDETLSLTVYIGVVVKIGKVKQDYSDIERQIEECELERSIENGKKKIFVTEVWVVTNNTISSNAQNKIHHKYKNKKIHFINGEKITNLIDDFYSDFWTDISADIGIYLREMLSKSASLTSKIDLLDTTSLESNVEHFLINVSDEVYADPGRKKIPKRLKIDKIIESEKFIFIEGAMGTGKSRLISDLVKDFSSSESFNISGVVPFITTMREFVSEYDGDVNKVIQFIEDKVSLKDEKYLIMLDAIDELKSSELEKLDILKNIYKGLSSRENCKVIVTSRPFDRPNIETEIDKYFKRYHLLPLTIKQMVSMVDLICKDDDIKSRLLNELEKSHLFKVLPKTPISAIILGKLLKRDIQEIPSTMTELYSKYTEIVLGRWDIDRGLQSQSEYDVVQNVTVNIAKYIIDHELECIAVSEAKDMFDSYVSSRKLKILEEKLFKKMINTSEIFSYNNDNDTIAFIHRTFAEYFYALYLERDNDAVISQDIYTLYWNNIYFFYLGLKKDCPELIEAIDNIDFTEEEAKLSQMISNGNFLLASYLTPYSVIEKSLLKTFSDMAIYFNRIINNEIRTPLVVLPKMQVLSVFMHSLSSSYAYEFFIEALSKKSLQLSCANSLTDNEFAELFLINNTLVSINKFDSFDLMVKNYGNKIPEIFQVGMNHCIDEKKYSSVLKKYLKMHRKTVNKKITLKQLIIDMYEKPIDEKMVLEFKKEYELENKK